MKLTRKAMNREVVLMGILILVFALGIIYFIFHNTDIEAVKNSFNPQKTNGNNPGSDTSTETTTTQTSTTTTGGGSFGGSSDGGGGSSGGSSSSGGTETTLPGDIDTQPCGFYAGEFGEPACGGYCEIGTCIVEGRSCYCKE